MKKHYQNAMKNL